MKGVCYGLLALFCVCATLSSLLPVAVRATRIDEMSFKPPFERVDSAGRRIVNDTWTYGGSADAKKHFVRLTTDRQSKKGYLWQTQPVGRDEFSAILTFRISGLGKRWFGDGIGLWFTNHKSFASGVNHGFTDSFTGVGIVVDTFVNPEHKGGHKDVSIQINDGTKNIDKINDEARIGCDADIRYHEQAATFDPVHSMSRLKVKINKRQLVVEIDGTSNGRWVACHEVTLPFSENWLESATIGITGATGALADNHDVIRFEAFTDFTDNAMGMIDSEAIMHTVSKDYKKWMDSPNCGSDCLIAVLQKEISNFRVEAEHRFADLKEKTENTVSKLKNQEKENERRVAEIEAKLNKDIDATLDATHENIGAAVDYKITKQLNENPDLVGGGSWKTPFSLLLLGLGVGGFFVYRKYQALMKSHLLMLFAGLESLSSHFTSHTCRRSLRTKRRAAHSFAPPDSPYLPICLSVCLPACSGTAPSIHSLYLDKMLAKTLLALALFALKCVAADPMDYMTFKEPFDQVNTDGKRVLSEHFEIGGSTDVKKNFVRLTPDRQSKRGNIWSRQVINKDQFVSVITYRIHGQGKKWFGDGIGIWLTHEGRYLNGDNHGFTDHFYGVGIILDTFKNVEHRGGHKDVTVQINDGTKTLDTLNDETKVGCDAAFRYHSKSASFDPVYSSSRLRIKIDGNKLTLEVDPTNQGSWTECYAGSLPFSHDWLRRATLGITASTGALADNHDIISVKSFDNLNDYGVAQADADVWTHNYSKEFESLVNNAVCDQSCKISILQKFMKNFHVETEHWFEELKEQTDNTVLKLKGKEQENQKKIQALTDRMNEMLESKIGQKMADVRNQVHEKIASKVEGELLVAQSSWRLPFFFLLVVLASALAFAYQKYQKLVKSHLF